MATYEVRVSHGEKYWLVHAPAVDRWTQARTLREVDVMARDLISIMTGEAPESIELAVRLDLPESVQAHLQRAAQLRDDAAAAQSQAAGEQRAAAKELAGSGMPLRDVGQALGVSHQRAHQLVSA